MCIMATKARANATRLYSIPVTYGASPTASKPGTAIVYVNNLTRKSDKNTKAELMIVPFPNPGGEAALDDVVLTPYTEWSGLAKDIRKQFNDRRITRSRGAFSDGIDEHAKAIVHRIGKYKCSVVANVSVLLDRIDWAEFDTPADLEQRLAVLHDERVCPSTCGFVVAQAVEDIHKDGFAVVYPGGDVMLPTCHEAPAEPGGLVNYDVACYVVGATPIWRGATTRTAEQIVLSSDTSFVQRVRSARPIAGTIAGNGHAAHVRPCLRDDVTVLSKMVLTGADVNTNLFIAGTGDFDPNNPMRQLSFADVEHAKKLLYRHRNGIDEDGRAFQRPSGVGGGAGVGAGFGYGADAFGSVLADVDAAASNAHFTLAPLTMPTTTTTTTSSASSTMTPWWQATRPETDGATFHTAWWPPTPPPFRVPEGFVEY